MGNSEGQDGEDDGVGGDAGVLDQLKKVPQPEYKAMKKTLGGGGKVHPVDGILEAESGTVGEERLSRGVLANVLSVVEDDGNVKEPKLDSKGPRRGECLFQKARNSYATGWSSGEHRGSCQVSFTQGRAASMELSPLLVDQHMRFLLGRHVMGLISDGPPRDSLCTGTHDRPRFAA